MFRRIRKIKNEMSLEATKALLKTCRRGVLAVHGDDGYPYAMPLNYYYDEEAGKIYFHGAKAGHKVDAIRACDQVCFTVYGNESVRDIEWAPYVQSAVVFGRCRLIEDRSQTIELVKTFAMKYYPSMEAVEKEVAESAASVQMFEICIEHMTGKEIQEI